MGASNKSKPLPEQEVETQDIFLGRLKLVCGDILGQKIYDLSKANPEAAREFLLENVIAELTRENALRLFDKRFAAETALRKTSETPMTWGDTQLMQLADNLIGNEATRSILVDFLNGYSGCSELSNPEWRSAAVSFQAKMCSPDLDPRITEQWQGMHVAVMEHFLRFVFMDPNKSKIENKIEESEGCEQGVKGAWEF